MTKKPSYAQLERRIMELENENPENIYRLMLESMSDTVIVTDGQGKMKYICPNTTVIFGLSHGEIMNLNTIQALLNGWSFNYLDLEQKGEISNIDWSFKDVSGQQKELLISAKSININGGKALFVMRDITDFVLAEAELKESEERYRVTATETGQIFYSYNPDTDKVIWSGAVEAITGYSCEEFNSLGTNGWLKNLHPNDNEMLLEKLDQAIKSKDKYDVKYRFRRKDGTYIYLEEHGTFVSNDQNYSYPFVGAIKNITKQEEVEESLKESEERFQHAMDASQDGLFDWDLITNAIYYSPGWKRMLGYQDNELPNDFSIWETLTEPDDAKKSWEMQQKIVNKQLDRFELEFKMKHKDGHWIDILSRAKAIFNEDDVAVRIVGTHVDISERKQAELELIKSENQYNAIVENSGDYIMRYDRDHRHIWANQGAIKSTGLPPEKFLGKTHREMNFPEHLCQLWEKNIDEVFTFGEVRRVEFDVELEKGLMTLDLQFNPEFDEKGNVLSVIGVSRDITERKRSEEVLLESKTQLESALESMTDAVFISNKEGQFIEFNKSFATFHRLESKAACLKELSGWSDFLDVYTLDGTLVPIEMWVVNRALRGETGVNVEYRLHRKDTGETWFGSYNFAPIRSEEGGIYGSVVVARDITENRILQARLQQSQKMESIGTLAGGIAHDFNNILFPIVGYTQMLLEDTPEDSPDREGLNQIYTSALRAKSLVKQILTFSRQENSELMLMKIQPIVKEALKLIRSTIPTTIEIIQDINPDCGVIKADPTQIHQIVMNLATNAYHAMEETGGELKVRLKEIELGEYDILRPDMKPGIYVCLTITDTGRGMDKELTRKIFDPFFTTKEKGKGTGMGLSVVHGIVTAIGGAIQVYSEPGEGTQFHVYLPVEKNFSEEQVIHSKIEIQGGTEQILLVDDEEAILSMEKRMLERLGYQVTSCTSSLESLEVFRDNPGKFDIVITDMAMPNMPGDKLSAELIKIRPDIPILLCTGFSETMSEERAASLGIKDFLWKPIIMKDLAQKIREVLDEN